MHLVSETIHVFTEGQQDQVEGVHQQLFGLLVAQVLPRELREPGCKLRCIMSNNKDIGDCAEALSYYVDYYL